jgi:hypothetical protein
MGIARPRRRLQRRPDVSLMINNKDNINDGKEHFFIADIWLLSLLASCLVFRSPPTTMLSPRIKRHFPHRPTEFAFDFNSDDTRREGRAFRGLYF